MAGIGFELKKIFSKKSLTAKLGGVFYSVFSTIGHVLTVIAVLLLVRYFMDIYHTSIYVRELYAAIILYSFIFPLIFSSGICIILSRYIADMLWQGKHSDVLASAKGVIALYAIIASLPAIILLAHATDLSLLLRLFAYLLYMNMGIIFILMVYVSALKDYTQIALSFFIGMSVVLLLSWYTVAYHPFSGEIVTYLIGYFALGTTIIACGIYLGIRKYFKKASGNCFSFLKYFGKHKFLFWSNTFYTAALYIQNFSFWINTATRDQVSVFVYSEEFDLGTAFALYTTLPVVVIFVVRAEIYFYETYRNYLQAITVQTGEHIKKAKELMERRMWLEYSYCFEIQTLISIILIAVGLILMPLFYINPLTIDVFPYLSLGIMLTYFVFLACTLLQYFENYRDSFYSMLLCFCLNIVFCTLFVIMGPHYYGLGIIFAAIPSLFLSIYKLYRTMREVDYRVFCLQTFIKKETITKTDKIIDFLND